MTNGVIGVLPRESPHIQLAPALRHNLAKNLTPLTIIRAPRGYGKTSLIRALLQAPLPIDVTNYVVASRSTRAEFWESLASEIVNLPGLGFETFIEEIGADPRRRLIIIDDFHQAGAAGGLAELDDELVDLTRRFEQLYVIVSGRVPRPIDTLGSMALSTTIVGPGELALNPERLQHLATDLGVKLRPNRAASLVDGVAGWPALLRLSLGQAVLNGEEPDFDLTVLMNYLAVVLDDSRKPALRAFLMRACVADALTVDVARALADDGLGSRYVQEADALGLVYRVGDTSTYEFPPEIKRALMEMVRAESPETINEANHILDRVQSGARDPFQQLERALDASDWKGALRILHREFLFLTTKSVAATAELLRRLPIEIQQESAPARVILSETTEMPEDPDHYVALVVTDLSGQLAEVLLDLGQDADAVLDEVTARLAWGLGSAACGQLDTATYVLHRCWDRAGNDHDAHAHIAAAVIAAIHAYRGELHQARTWLAERERIMGRRGVSPPRFAQIAYSFTDAMILVDSGELSAGALLDQIPEPRSREVMWALTVFARARHSAVYDDVDRVVAMINNLRSAVRYQGRGSASEAILIHALVELLIVANMLPIARELAGRLGPTDTATVLHARLALTQNEFEDAMRLAAHVEDSLSQFPRLLAERDVILASAAHALGDFAAAQEHFDHALRTIRVTGQRRALVILPHYLFVVFAGGDPEVLEMWPRAEAATESWERVSELTPREVQILRWLLHASGPSAIAKSLGLSVNTVKTHVQAVYRKLGVSSRAEAVEHVCN